MIRIKIRYEGEKKKKVLWFDESIEFSILLRKMISKLGVTHERDDGDIDLSELFRLRSEDDSLLVRDTNRIEYGDELVLERKMLITFGDSNANVPAKKEHSGKLCGQAIHRMGTIIRKRFHDGKYYAGEVVDYDATNKYYKIKYKNGDKEDFDEKDMKLYYKQNQHFSGTKYTPKQALKQQALAAGEDADDSGAISISSDEDDDSSSGENIEEEYDSFPFEYECQIKNDSNHNEDDNTRHRKRLKRNPKKPIESPLEVIMNGRDIPSAPGKSDHRSEDNDAMEEKSLLVDGAGKKKAEQDVKHRIIKLLNTGFHDQSNEHEAKNAMKLAQKLMRKHNLSQALLLKEREAKNSQNAQDEEVLKGGMVRVSIINRKTRKVAVFAQWIARLTLPILKNFGVHGYTSTRRGVRCDVVFFGIYTNAQLAGYAFKVAIERIAQMMAEYQPQKDWRDISTKSSRLSYAIGIARGISEDVEKNLETEEEQRKRKLERARLAGSKGEAYAESDDEDFGIDNEGPGIYVTNEEVGSNNDVSRNSLPPNHISSSEAKPDPQPRSLSGIDLENRVEELEKEEQAALVLVDYNEKVAKEVLKEHNIELSAVRRQSSAINFDNRSYEKGIEDAKEIDINQRAIRDEVKVKVEKK
jgi:hypothetical protein